MWLLGLSRDHWRSPGGARMVDPFTTGLPESIDTERFILGSILLNDELFPQIIESLNREDFALEKHRRIFDRMRDLYQDGIKIDRVTLLDELIKQGQLESVDGMAYLVSLDDGLPEAQNVDAYVRIVQEKSTLRKMIWMAQRAIDRCLTGDDPEDIRSGLETALGGLEDSDDQKLARIGEIVEEEGGPGNILHPPIGGSIPTPWGGLNRRMEGGGIPRGQLVIVAARPSMGKTSIGTQIAMAGAERGFSGIFATLEMRRPAIIRRMAMARAGIDSLTASRGAQYLSAEERQRLQLAMAWLMEAPIWVTNKHRTVEGLRTACRAFKAKRPLDYVIVDYIGLMQHLNSRLKRYEQIGDIARGLKLLAEELGAAMIVLCQLTRDSAKDGQEPELHHLRDSGSIEEHADVVIMPHRLPDQPKDSVYLLCKWFLRKQRNAPVGEVPMVFQRVFTRYIENLDENGTGPDPQQILQYGKT